MAKIDLSKLRGENCIAVSSAYFLDKYLDLKPMYHVCAPVHLPYGLQDADEVVRNLIATNFKGRKIFFGEGYLPTGYYHATTHRAGLCQASEVYYLDYRKLGFADWHLLLDRYWYLHRNPFRPRSVLYCALQLAVYLGFNEIYLVGFDHDYIAALDSRKDSHFYNEQREIPRIEEPIEDLLYGWSQRLSHYKLMFEYLSSRGVTIYNSTEGGRLDQFPRLPYDKAVRKLSILETRTYIL